MPTPRPGLTPTAPLGYGDSMLRIGVTGPMASGKSTVARRFEERGAVRIDGDALGWEALRTAPVREAIAAAFGPGVLGTDGEVDRAALGAVVFADAAAMARLNAIVQPPLRALVVRRLAEVTEAPSRVAVLDAAMLTTWRLEPDLDGVVEVIAPEPLRIERLRASRGCSEAEAATRVRGQRLPPVRDARRHWRIQNDGDPATLLASADRVWREIETVVESRADSWDDR